MNQQNNPYRQKRENNLIIRTFSQSVSEDELVWHRDEKDREVTITENSNWMFQFDNELPQVLKGVIFIPKNTYHRLIKGTGELTLSIVEF